MQNETMTERLRLRIGSFAIHATRGVIHNQTMRRWLMFGTLLAAMLLAFVGSTFLEGTISAREHPVWFILFWIACAWLTITALLLAIFDLLLVRAQSRAARRALQEKLKHV